MHPALACSIYILVEYASYRSVVVAVHRDARLFSFTRTVRWSPHAFILLRCVSLMPSRGVLEDGPECSLPESGTYYPGASIVTCCQCSVTRGRALERRTRNAFDRRCCSWLASSVQSHRWTALPPYVVGDARAARPPVRQSASPPASHLEH